MYSSPWEKLEPNQPFLHFNSQSHLREFPFAWNGWDGEPINVKNKQTNTFDDTAMKVHSIRGCHCHRTELINEVVRMAEPIWSQTKRFAMNFYWISFISTAFRLSTLRVLVNVNENFLILFLFRIFPMVFAWNTRP